MKYDYSINKIQCTCVYEWYSERFKIWNYTRLTGIFLKTVCRRSFASNNVPAKKKWKVRESNEERVARWSENLGINQWSSFRGICPARRRTFDYPPQLLILSLKPSSQSLFTIVVSPRNFNGVLDSFGFHGICPILHRVFVRQGSARIWQSSTNRFISRDNRDNGCSWR